VLVVAETARVEIAVPPWSPTGLTLKDVLSPGAETAAVRLTLQQKLFILVRLIVDVDEAPARIVMLARLALIVKSTTVTDMVMECVKEPLVPTTVTV
jgi:hypothetical protein